MCSQVEVPVGVVALQRLDDALFDLRRVWERPEMRRRFIDILGERVEQGVLRTLRAIELAETDPPCVGDVATALKVDASTASRLVESAAEAGYVDRTDAPSDRRRTALHLSRAGRQLLWKSTRARRQLLADAVATWDEEDVAALAALLSRLNLGLMVVEENGQ